MENEKLRQLQVSKMFMRVEEFHRDCDGYKCCMSSFLFIEKAKVASWSEENKEHLDSIK